MCGIANADVYVVTNSSNNVYAISNQPDIVVPSGDTQTVLKGQTISNLPISGSPQLYNFSNGGFTLNSAAVQSQQAAQAAAIAAQTAQTQTATSALSKINDAISRVASQDVLTQQELQALASQS